MTKCKFFGVRSSKGVEDSACQKCEMFKKCTIETNLIMGTSVVIDSCGVTKHMLPKGELSDVELMFEKFGESLKKEKDDPKEKDDSKEKKGIKEKKVSRRVTGLSKLCRSLKAKNISEADIEKEVAKLYFDSGHYTQAQAAAKAKNCVANMVWDR